jgi:hypothetical protein
VIARFNFVPDLFDLSSRHFSVHQSTSVVWLSQFTVSAVLVHYVAVDSETWSMGQQSVALRARSFYLRAVFFSCCRPASLIFLSFRNKLRKTSCSHEKMSQGGRNV